MAKEKDIKDIKEEKKQGKVGTIIGIVLCLLLVPILVFNVIIIIKGLVNPSKVPSVAGYSPLIVLTDSMLPDIKSGDLIIVKTLEPEEVAVGDVIAFFDPDGTGTSVLTHRVVELTKTDDGRDAWRTKGDANNTEDPTPAPFDNLVGIYKGKINGAGNVAMFLQSTPGLIVCIAIPLVLLVAFELIRRKKYEKVKNKDTEALLEELEALKAKQAEAEKAKANAAEKTQAPEPEKPPVVETVEEKAEETVEAVEEKVEETVETVEDKVEEVAEKAEDDVENAVGGEPKDE
ncbi:MAG: signal peptidase I [Clostridia bacterium]|nr:signal peptidase I [Clostridia bacterium]